MKIVFCHNDLYTLYLYRGDVIRHFSDKGWEVVLVFPEVQDDEDHRKRFEGCCRFVTIDMQPNSQNILADQRLFKNFIKLYRLESPDVVINYTVKPNIYSALAAHHLGIRTIDFMAGLGYLFDGYSIKKRLARFLYRLGLSVAEKVVVLNRANYEVLADGYVKREKLFLFECGEGVDMQKYPLCESTYTTTRFLMVARLLHDKGYAQFVEAARIVRTFYPEVKFEILGKLCEDNPNGIVKSVLDADVKDGAVDYLGESTDVPSVLKRNGVVVVVPSYYREGLNRSLMEASSMGRPIITTDVPGCRELVDNGINGFLVEPKNGKALADACLKFLKLSEEEKRSMSKASYEKCKSQFDVRFVIKRYVELI